LYGFGKGMDPASAKSVFLRKIRPLVKEMIVIKTINGYMLGRGVRNLIRDLQEFPDDYRKLIEEGQNSTSRIGDTIIQSVLPRERADSAGQQLRPESKMGLR